MAKCFLYQRIDRLSMYRDVNKGLLMIESKFQSTIIQHAVIKCLFFYIPDGELVEFELSLADTYGIFFPSLTYFITEIYTYDAMNNVFCGTLIQKASLINNIAVISTGRLRWTEYAVGLGRIAPLKETNITT